MTIKLAGLAILAALSLGACQAPHHQAKMQSHMMTPETQRVVSGSYELDGESVPLPPGDWRVVIDQRMLDSVDQGTKENFAVLMSDAGGVVDRTVILWTQHKFGFQDIWHPYAGCAQSDAYFQETAVNDGQQMDCWQVRPLSLGTGGDVHPLIEAMRESAGGKALPVVMLGVRIMAKRQPEKRMYVEYLWNPDLILPKDGDGFWLPQDWSKSAVGSDPRKAAVVEELTDWGRRWRAKIVTTPGV